MARESITAAPFVPAHATLEQLQIAAKACEGCPLYQRATQTVFGAGPESARVILVGEQPGDQEDLQGKPFVGPAGRLLDKALEEAEIDRKIVYVTNAVKHFKWEPRGKRRIHQKPNALEINACRPWLEAEIDVVQPEVVVALGATAAQSLLGPKFRVMKERGIFFPHPRAKWVMATVHPSALLRAPDSETRHREFALFVEDLRRVHSKVA
jgi:uracil-DNA glycosylase family protein